MVFVHYLLPDLYFLEWAKNVKNEDGCTKKRSV